MRRETRVIIDCEKVEAMAAIQCTQQEICAVLGISTDTFQRSKDAYAAFDRGREKGKASLRRMQWKAAEGGSVAMLIWLGKQWLGQSERVRVGNEEDSPLIPFDLVRAAVQRLKAPPVTIDGTSSPVQKQDAAVE